MNFVSNYKMTSTNEKYKQNQEILAKWKQNNKNQQANNNSITNISPKHLQERIIQPMVYKIYNKIYKLNINFRLLIDPLLIIQITYMMDK